MYLRGVNQLELQPILNFIYTGQASFYHERMKDFIKIGKDLQIKEIKEVPEEDEMVDTGENMPEKPHNDVISEEVLRDDNDSYDENEIESSSAWHESSQQISVPSDSSQCQLCSAVFAHRTNMLNHVRNKHEGVRYPCSQCDYKATKQFNLKIHTESVHEGVKYPCNQCNHKATQRIGLKKHIESVHEGIKYPCNQCNHKATQRIGLKTHIESVHEGIKYPCDQCDYKATTQSNLTKHKKIKHGC